LTRASIALRKIVSKKMDGRVKPGHDGSVLAPWMAGSSPAMTVLCWRRGLPGKPGNDAKWSPWVRWDDNFARAALRPGNAAARAPKFNVSPA
jgi:hypothetical protein